jgi:hypothetical protein
VTELVRLRRAIRDLHGLESEHVRSEPVRETFQGQVAWEGTVEVFKVFGHSKAQYAYAWSFEADSGARAFTAVLGVPPVNSALDAVRAAIAAEHVRRKG